MALPRRCKSCRCYVAPQLDRCPRCRKRAPILVVVTKPTKEDRAAERELRDSKLPTIKAIHMEWVPSVLALESNRNLLDEVRRRLDATTEPRARNALRSEIRCIKQVLARAEGVNSQRRWTTEIVRTKRASIMVFVSPKNRRYVLASRDGPATLRIQHRKKSRGMLFSRLLLFEKSPHARALKKDRQDDVAHVHRKKAKKARRLKKRQAPTLL